MSFQWVEKPGVAMYDDANWGLEVTRKSAMSQPEAEAFALADDRITFFFRMTEPMFLPKHGQFNPGDAVFFSGKPWYGSAPQANAYEKPSHHRTTYTYAPRANPWVYLKADVKVPHVVPPQGTFFIWPGLSPRGIHYAPICNGVLQPVLTWGPSCAPNPNGLAPGGWWISGQYVNTDPAAPPAFQGCHGGDRMAVQAGDELTCELQLQSDLSWLQTVTNQTREQQKVTYSIALTTNGQDPQAQNMADFVVEDPNGSSLTQAVSLYNIVARVAAPAEGLGADLQTQRNVAGIHVNAAKTELRIERVVVYNPIFDDHPACARLPKAATSR